LENKIEINSSIGIDATLHSNSEIKKIEDKKSRTEIEAERSLSEYVESGCRFPVGALGISNSSMLKLTVSAYSVDGKKSITIEKTGDIDKPKS